MILTFLVTFVFFFLTLWEFYILFCEIKLWNWPFPALENLCEKEATPEPFPAIARAGTQLTTITLCPVRARPGAGTPRPLARRGEVYAVLAHLLLEAAGPPFRPQITKVLQGKQGESGGPVNPTGHPPCVRRKVCGQIWSPRANTVPTRTRKRGGVFDRVRRERKGGRAPRTCWYLILVGIFLICGGGFFFRFVLFCFVFLYSVLFCHSLIYVV